MSIYKFFDADNGRLKGFEPTMTDVDGGFFGSDGGTLKDRNSTKITQIIIHFTRGWGADTSIDWWKTRTPEGGIPGTGTLATPFVIEGNISGITEEGEKVGKLDSTLTNGAIYKVYEDYENKYTDHVSNGTIHKRSIGIEVANLGPLRKEDGNYFLDLDSGGTTVSYRILEVSGTIDIVEYATPYRGEKYFHAINKDQLKSLKDLITFLALNYDVPLENVPNEIGDYTDDVKNGDPGLYSHTQVTASGKWDWHPQPELVKMLVELNYLGKANSLLKDLYNSLTRVASSAADIDLINDFCNKLLKFYITHDLRPYALRIEKKKIKKFWGPDWINEQEDFFPNIDKFATEIIPLVKFGFYEHLTDISYRIFGYLDQAKYRDYFTSNS